ncbi:prefoldin subunit 6 [Rhizophagus irregularis]|uniref:Prefoldin subunit 6 n=2 Tax=Rhizophagus irregularis TaxID=588596 RepID=A0A2I1ECV6_9GLOM|nr:prefoldin subunit 6 [Rhizophagus irregularis DAOM 181602=DAOM 197198]PKC12490.1 prefoldin subunit 6 [Rhizophagus irregularis]RGB36502.1 prefoldin subunit 6 [Rhizophagus diaphanus] [Rhizophagus sp. MUCL 43196]PKC68396.1 prefoldin subunit 6 [Rhizophagus irregularis]PKK76538.1 prefoldin subunit 6 [Rhizophagus irregularis]PKY19963.1 prefoldin subunit 6 [Rhizophagus irregularis]|eukprot:XP_025181171.1 prefoldin subunit 6 [Rhizophagus irregularis DAOM 181602=DAOM 197198]
MEARLEALTSEYQKIQKDLSNAIESRQRLDSQLQENEVVQKEFKLLKDDANIYKLIGPVLVKQDKVEATTNVDKRLEYIKSEIQRVEKQLTDLNEKSEKKKLEVIELQKAYQDQIQKTSASS